MPPRGGRTIPGHRNQLPAPTGWPNIKSTYNVLRTKLEEPSVATVDKLEAIDYWIARLNQDKTTISLNEPLVSY